MRTFADIKTKEDAKDVAEEMLGTKLKTLNDIKPTNEFHRNKFSVRHGHTELIGKVVLRAEAIKEIKQIRSLRKLPFAVEWEKYSGLRVEFSKEAIGAIINYIKWKNNLSEEDLR